MHSSLNCCLFLLAILLVTAGVVVWLLTAAGLITMPMISSWTYKTPVPIHEVVSGTSLEVYLSETFNDLLTERLQAGGGALIDRSVQVALPESSITASFRDLTVGINVPWFDFEKAQVAVGDGGLEIFLPIAGAENENALILFLIPGAFDGLVTLESSQITLGNLTAPNWLSGSVLTPLMRQGLNPLNQLVGRYASIKEITISDGTLMISGDLTVEVMEFD